MDNSHKVFVYKSTYLTFKAERALKKAGISCKIVTKPRGISSDCGLAVRVATSDEPQVMELMQSSGIEMLGVY
jgi:hypothetical protein